MGFIIIYVPADIPTFLKWGKLDVADIDKFFFRQGLRHKDGNFQ